MFQFISSLWNTENPTTSARLVDACESHVSEKIADMAKLKTEIDDQKLRFSEAESILLTARDLLRQNEEKRAVAICEAKRTLDNLAEAISMATDEDAILVTLQMASEVDPTQYEAEMIELGAERNAYLAKEAESLAELGKERQKIVFLEDKLHTLKPHRDQKYTPQILVEVLDGSAAAEEEDDDDESAVGLNSSKPYPIIVCAP